MWSHCNMPVDNGKRFQFRFGIEDVLFSFRTWTDSLEFSSLLYQALRTLSSVILFCGHLHSFIVSNPLYMVHFVFY